jgi:alpha-tubulin suppressor-like RCC1 family protein
VGGVERGEVPGVVYTWGNDQYGQLGLENFVQGGKYMGSHQSLKILHPRLIVALKDEVIREICCGYAHTLAVNQYG